MKTFLCWSGWVTVFVLCAALGMVYLWGARQAEEVNRLGIERSKQEAQLNDLKKQLAVQAESIKPTTPPPPVVQPAPPTTKVPDQASPPPPTPPSPEPQTPAPETPSTPLAPVPSPVEATPTPEPSPNPPPPTPPDPSRADSVNQTSPMTSTHVAEPASPPQPPAKRANKYYDAYFSLVELPNEIEQQIRTILQRYQADRSALTQDITQNRIPAEAYASKMIEMRNQARAALGTILIPDHMTIWNNYEATLPERLMGQQLEQALITGGTTLPLTARAHIQEVLLQEMAPVFEAQHKDLLPLELPPGMAAQPITEAYNRARMRLEKDFSPEEMKQAGLFLEKQLSQLTAGH